MMIPTILKKRPLVFGDPQVIAALKQVEAQEKLCEVCEGEGQVECPDCHGSGERPQPSEQTK